MANVDNMCKSQCISRCNLWVKKCVNLTNVQFPRAKLTFSTKFSHSLHNVSHNPLTPIVQLFYPLFHNPYYYNYYIYINKGKD